MVSQITDLHAQLDSVQTTLYAAKGSVKNAAILRNFTDLQRILNNATLWSGESHILTHLVRIRSPLVEASNDEEFNIPIDRTRKFLEKVMKLTRLLSSMN